MLSVYVYNCNLVILAIWESERQSFGQKISHKTYCCKQNKIIKGDFHKYKSMFNHNVTYTIYMPNMLKILLYDL